jgi:membrane protein
MTFFRNVVELLHRVIIRWSQDKGHLMAAATAYYMMFAIAPLLVISINIAGVIFGEAAVQGELFAQLDHLIGAEAALFIQLLVENASVASSGRIATILGVAILVYGASNLFYQLKMALNFIWRISPEPDNSLLHWVKTRFLSLIMVLTLGVLFVLAFGLSFMLSAIGDVIVKYVPELSTTASVSQIVLMFVLMPLLVALLFKVLPDASIAWRDVILGAYVTALLLRVGLYVLSFFAQRFFVGSIYGAAGSLVGILFFVYYSAQILFFGAEFTQVYAKKYGSGIHPLSHAVVLVRERRSVLPLLPAPLPLPEPIPVEETPERRLERKTAVAFLSMAVVLFIAFLLGRKVG